VAQAGEADAGSLNALLTRGSLDLGLSLSPAQVNQLIGYIELLQRWNGVHSLTSVREANQSLHLHVLDSLAAIPPLRRHAAGRDLRVLDVGTGAGLPAIVLAIMQPTWWVTAVDAVAKKIAFVRQVAGQLAVANLAPVHARAESLRGDRRFDVAVSRAFGSLRDFVSLTRPALCEGGVWVAMKGKRPDDELAQVPRDFQVFHVEPVQVPGMQAQRCLVWMRVASDT
jgi:16S rRNA (guanine527-N7)-methyltransferase